MSTYTPVSHEHLVLAHIAQYGTGHTVHTIATDTELSRAKVDAVLDSLLARRAIAVQPGRRWGRIIVSIAPAVMDHAAMLLDYDELPSVERLEALRAHLADEMTRLTTTVGLLRDKLARVNALLEVVSD